MPAGSRIFLLVSAVLMAASLSAAAPWPSGRVCAVSLTYDDAIESQILNAAFDLDQHHLKGSFFITGASRSISENAGAWSALAAKGHELGNHTTQHPCGGPTGTFNLPENRLEAYDLDRMAKELDATSAFVKALGMKGPLTFAYPCGQAWVGKEQTDYSPLVKERFLAARGVNNRLADPATVDLFNTPAWDGSKKDADYLKGLVDDAHEKGAWLIIMFHGVGGDYLSVSGDAHQALCEYLASKQDVWTAPFGTVAKAVAKFQAEKP